jgi:hypothetical protein
VVAAVEPAVQPAEPAVQPAEPAVVAAVEPAVTPVEPVAVEPAVSPAKPVAVEPAGVASAAPTEPVSPAETPVSADAVDATAGVDDAPTTGKPTAAREAAAARPEGAAEPTPAIASVDPASAPMEPPTAVVEAPSMVLAPELTAGDAPEASAPSAPDSPSSQGEAAPTEDAGEAGGRRKKRRGRRESQPSLPRVDPGVAVAPAEPKPAGPSPDRERFTGGRRGPDLLSDLFDAVMEMSFLHSGTDVCAFVAAVITQHLRCDAVLVFGYDINRDEFVVHGEANTGRMEDRVRAHSGAYGTATRTKRAVNLAAASGGDRADADCDGGPSLFVPSMFHDRLFALVQVARLPGSPGFEADELDAVTYIAGQLSEALAHHSLRQTATDLAEKAADARDTVRRR